TNDLLTALRAYPDARTDDTSLSKRDRDRRTQNSGGLRSQAADVSAATPIVPIIPIGFRHGDRLLNYFSMVTTVGTPQTVAAQELRIESMVPADETTFNYIFQTAFEFLTTRQHAFNGWIAQKRKNRVQKGDARGHWRV